ncbi:hypothetical protein GCM10020006_05740 [Fructilactobacillus sanfranciscensis]
MAKSVIPEALASSTIQYISLGTALVSGKKRVPKPAAGIIAFVTFFINKLLQTLEIFNFRIFQFLILFFNFSFI